MMNFKLFTKLNRFSLHHILKFRNSSKTTLFLEKPLISIEITQNADNEYDLIGPPDKKSNLRPVIKKKCIKNESKIEEKYRKTFEQTQQWNQEFWAMHNTNFLQEKQAFIERKLIKLNRNNAELRVERLNSDEMSEFYKEFLDKNWTIHVQYNFKWYRRNCHLLLLALRCNLEKLIIIRKN